MRDEKYIYPIGYEDNEAGKGFSITGNPNPFSVFITLTISVEDALLVPEIQIYNTKMQLVRTFKNAKASNAEYSFQWNGTNTVGEKVKPGIYVIVCSVGDKRTARKIVYQP
jgi:flagellar hook assembly protein FlgD